MTKQDEITFTCIKCGEIKSIKEFHKSSMNQCGHRWECKSCTSLYDKAQYAKSDSIRLAKFKYGKTDMARYARLKSNAKRRGTDFCLDKLDFLIWFQGQDKVCHYCGTTLNTNGRREEQISVDRKDNIIGYTLENIVLSCQQCNTIKGNIFTESEMLEIAEKYLKPKMEVRCG